MENLTFITSKTVLCAYNKQGNHRHQDSLPVLPLLSHFEYRPISHALQAHYG